MLLSQRLRFMAFFMLSFPRITKNCLLYVSIYYVTENVLLVEAETTFGVL